MPWPNQVWPNEVWPNQAAEQGNDLAGAWSGTFTLTGTFDDLMGVLSFTLGLSANLTIPDVSGLVAFELALSAELDVPGLSYRGFDVLDVDSSEAPDDTLTRNRFRLDNRIGILYTFDRSLRSVVERAGHELILTDRADIERFRFFVWARRGRLKPFWLSSGQHDLVLAADMPASSSFLTVQATGYSTHQFPQAARRHLVLALPNGTRLHRGVLGASAGASTETLVLDAPPGVLVPRLGTRVSFLRLCRLAVDDPEWRWRRISSGDEAAAVLALDFVELPAEAPTP